MTFWKDKIYKQGKKTAGYQRLGKDGENRWSTENF